MAYVLWHQFSEFVFLFVGVSWCCCLGVLLIGVACCLLCGVVF